MNWLHKKVSDYFNVPIEYFLEQRGERESEMYERINNIVLDYENGIVLINGKKTPFPVQITIKQNDGWNSRKILNYDPKETEEVIQRDEALKDIANIVIDVSEITQIESQQRQRLLIRSEIEKALQTLRLSKMAEPVKTDQQ